MSDKTSPFASLAGTGAQSARSIASRLQPTRPPALGPFYAGIGSRTTPPAVLQQFRDVAARLEAEGWMLRSGGAPGADQAFEAGIGDLARAEIYLPWNNFESKAHGIVPGTVATAAAREIAATVHPVFNRLPRGAQSLHTRNVFQVCGVDVFDPATRSSFVLCWTLDGAETSSETGPTTGGTGTAIRLASNLGVPVLNFKRPDALHRLNVLLEKMRPLQSPAETVDTPTFPTPRA